MSKRRANGEGTLRQRKDGRWESTIMIGWHPDGRRKYKSFYGTTRAELQKKVLAWKHGYVMEGICQKDYLFREWSEMWFQMHKEHISPSTQEGYRYSLRILNNVY